MNIFSTSTDDLEEIPLPSIDSEGLVQVPGKVGNRGKEVDRLTKELVVVQTNAGMDQTKAAEIFDIPQSQVSSLERGFNTSGIENRKEDKDLKLLGQQTKHKIVDLATTKLMSGLGFLDMSALKQKEIPGALNQIASVIDKVQGNNQASGTNIQFVVMQPVKKSEDDFETIVINER